MNKNLDKVRASLLSIIQLATCDESLFNDGIDKEIEQVAKEGLKALENDLSKAARRSCEVDA